MTYSDATENLLRDVVVELLEKTRQAKREAGNSDADYDKGRHLGLYEAVSLISQQAKAFGLSLERIGLGSVDVDRELL